MNEDRVAEAALRNEIDELVNTVEGCNDQLFDSARALGQFVAADRLDKARVEEELKKACEANGYMAREPHAISPTIRNGLQAGANKPRYRDRDKDDRQAGHRSESRDVAPGCAEARPLDLPSQAWLDRAQDYFSGLPDPATKEDGRAVLEARGLDPARAAEMGIKWQGYLQVDYLDQWGLESYTKEDGKKVESLYLPAGIVIASMIAGAVIGLEIRRQDAAEAEKRGKYCAIKGNATPIVFCAGFNGLPVVLCESALDAALIYQETAGQVQCMASMGASKGLSRYHAALAQQAPARYYIPDQDEAGQRATEKIKQIFPDIRILTLPPGIKDPGDLAKAHYQQKAEGLPTVAEWLQEQGLIR